MMQLGDILLTWAKRLNHFTKRTLTEATELSNRSKRILAELGLTKSRAAKGR
jgi:hypothetical protein